VRGCPWHLRLRDELAPASRHFGLPAGARYESKDH